MTSVRDTAMPAPAPLIDGSYAPGRQIAASARIIGFTSADEHGRPVTVGGIVLVPETPWPHEGSRPTVVVAPGTVGQGDQCAPSATFGRPGGGHIAQGRLLLGQGYRVVISDYIGLGGDGMHTYGNRVESGRVLLDAARAGLAIDGLPADSPVALWGYSQGGGAVAAAAELAPTLAPELNLRAAYAGAPPADLGAVLERIDGSILAGAIGWAVNGFAERHPVLAEKKDAILNPHGRRILDTVSGMCVEETGLLTMGQQTRMWTRDSRSIAEHIAESPKFSRIVDEQTIGRLTPSAAVLISIGRHDDLIPFDQAKNLADGWIARGAQVEMVIDEFPSVAQGTALNHSVASPATEKAALEFLARHLGGAVVPGSI
ncbi:lipase family protein [Corynebacterium sp. NPDC060344]|uniref:lipase family protein n=1 Tax=Corynebacterium sp. NPDC060344 TaxID=3347101 RepID=UPI00365CB660